MTLLILRLLSKFFFIAGFFLSFILIVEYVSIGFRPDNNVPMLVFNLNGEYSRMENIVNSIYPETLTSTGIDPLSYNEAIESTLRLLPMFRKEVPNCEPLLSIDNNNPTIKNNVVKKALFRAKKWLFDEHLFKNQIFGGSNNKCETVRDTMAYHLSPLSEEERDYPLAYSLLVYNDPVQIYFLLSAIYQPQNAYCIAIDGKSSDEFKKEMFLLTDCFANIYVMEVEKVEWYKYSVVNGVWKCIEFLANLEHDWKYYQYLSGVDLPLKTNLEMVRIFKRLNGTINSDVFPIPKDRISKIRRRKSPLPLWKSSLSGLLSRTGVNEMISNDKVQKLLVLLKDVECPDEALWTTIFGNPKVLNISGNFDAKAMYEKLTQERKTPKKECSNDELMKFNENRHFPEEPFVLHNFYISRYQVWMYTPHAKCGGKYTHWSCVYGIKDLPILLRRAELIAHKLYLTVEPAAYFCLYETVRLRALQTDIQAKFVGEAYSQIPQVKLSQGEDIKNVKYYFTDCYNAE